jgi:uncharacterized protein
MLYYKKTITMSDLDINFQNIGDSDNLNKEDFYVKFKERLIDTTSFPSVYLFKFIYPTKEETMFQIKKVFEKANPQFDYKTSKNRKYTSISVEIFALDADQVVSFYQEVAKIEGVIML